MAEAYHPDEESTQMILDCIERKSKLNDWETTFITSVSVQISTKPLTVAQIRSLNDIWDKVT